MCKEYIYFNVLICFTCLYTTGFVNIDVASDTSKGLTFYLHYVVLFAVKDGWERGKIGRPWNLDLTPPVERRCRLSAVFYCPF